MSIFPIVLVIAGAPVVEFIALITPLVLLGMSSLWHGVLRSKTTAAVLVATANLLACTWVVLFFYESITLKAMVVSSIALIAISMIAHYAKQTPLTRRLLFTAIAVVAGELIAFLVRWLSG